MTKLPSTFASPEDLESAMVQAVEAIRVHGVLVEACRASGIGRQTMRTLRKNHPDFRRALMDARQDWLDDLERAMADRARMPRGDLAGIFILKHNRERYREIQRVELTGKDGAPVAYTDAKAELLQRIHAAQSRGAVDVAALGGRNLSLEKGITQDAVRQGITKVDGSGKVRSLRK